MHFVSIKMERIAPSWRGDLISEVVAVVHQRAPGQVLIAFPLMTSGAGANLGPEMRLFGAERDLTVLCEHADFVAISGSIQRLDGSISTPQPAPTTGDYRIYYRDRRVDRRTPSRNRRHVRRGGHVADVDCKPDGLPYVRMVSFSTGRRRMSVFIREEQVDCAIRSPDGVNSYGLSTVARPSAVPHF